MSIVVERNMRQAKQDAVKLLMMRGGTIIFRELSTELLQKYMLRETNIKDVCVALADEGRIARTWKERNWRARKPGIRDPITLSS